MKKKPIAIDLFCGAGGLTTGLKKAGFEVIAGVENHPPALKTYALNHRKSRLFGNDIRQISPSEMMRDLTIKPGELDLLAGCPPCQGFSTHKTRNKPQPNNEDSRNDLVFEFLRFTRVMLPRAIMMENVPGLAKDLRISKIIKELKALGYKIDEQSISVKDTADFGVPQRRKRMILLASRAGIIEHPKKSQIKTTVRATIEHLPSPGNSGDPLHDLQYSRSKKTQNLISLVPKNGGSRSDLPKEYWLPCHIRRPDSYRDVYGRMSWDEVAPTITGGCHNPSKGRFLHPTENRAITLREAALLQTFPATYKFSMDSGKDSIALMIGNALPPEFIRRHAIQIRDHLKEGVNDGPKREF